APTPRCSAGMATAEDAPASAAAPRGRSSAGIRASGSAPYEALAHLEGEVGGRADVGAVVCAREVDAAHVVVGPRACLGDGGTARDHAEHTAARGAEHAGLVALGAGHE